MEDEDDVVFDRANLLNSSKTSYKDYTSSKTSPSCGKIVTTLCLCLAFFGLGLSLTIPGPTMPDLRLTTNTNTTQISTIFVARSIGYLAGSFVSGVLYDKINQNLLLSGGLFVTAVMTATTPLCHSLETLGVVIAFQGLSMGSIDTGGNVMCVNMWGRRLGPAMQAMHFTFGLGAFVAPLIAEPFLYPTSVNESDFGVLNSTVTVSTVPEPSNKGNVVKRDTNHNITLLKLTTSTAPLNTTTEEVKKPEVSGVNLSPDENTANGKNLAKHMKEMNAEDNTKLKTTTPTTPVPTKTTATSTTNSATTTTLASTTTTSTTTTLASTTTTSTTTTLASTTTTSPTTTTSATTPVISTTTNKTSTIPVADATTTTSTKIPNTIATVQSINKTKCENETGCDIDPIQDIKNKVDKILDTVKEMDRWQLAWLVISGLLLLLSLLFLCSCCCGPCTLRALPPMEKETKMLRKESVGFRIQMLALMFVFFFFYVGIEVTYGNLVSMFASDHCDWSKPRASMLVAIFWGTFSIGRLLAIPLSKCLSPSLMLITDLALTALSLFGLTLGLGAEHKCNDMVLWFCTGTLGLGLSTIFPTGIIWAERYMQITAKATSVFVVGSSLGELALPAMTGKLYDTKSTMWLVYTLLACTVIAGILYVIMQNLASNKGEKYQLLNAALNTDNDGDNMELDSAVGDSSNGLLSTNRKRVTFKLTDEIKGKRLLGKNRSAKQD